MNKTGWALPKRKKPSFHKKFCSSVDQLIVLEELGFVEDNHNRWNLVIEDRPDYKCIIIVSGKVISQVRLDPKKAEADITLIWDKELAGRAITKNELVSLIRVIKAGHGK